jgi:DNA-binding transcriptional LysR family regulator
MPLNLHHLRIFAAVAEHGGFSRAGGVLRLSQPAVSKAVRELERRVGLVLIDRGGRVPRLTGAGTLLSERARELFGVERDAEEELRALRGLERGVLRIAASTTNATYRLPPVLRRFRAAHPGVATRVASTNTRAVARLLLERRADIALVEGPVAHPRLEVRPWREDELVVIAPSAHPLAARRRVRASALEGEPFLVRERGSGTREVAERALDERGITLRIAMQLGGTEVIKQAVASGLGLAIVSRAAASDQLALGRIAVVALADLTIRRELTQLVVKGRAASAAAERFEELLASRGSDPKAEG